MKVIVDTREQTPLEFEVGGYITEVIHETCPVGDYWCRFEDGEEAKVVFERKSIGDLWGTLTNEDAHARFNREIHRAARHDLELVLIIEGSLSDVYRGNPRSRFRGPSMVKMLFTMWMRYRLLPVFCKDRDEMVRFITATFEACGKEYLRNKKPSPNSLRGPDEGKKC